ncbi:hypothetical protein EC973_007195 [Apophysomyces ossiformis]|uniref:Chromatin assembly factor 1 subunit A n=1 Tax=Apophysomyces ossiformis TaxID=679940 RepID=A0A8H7BVE4_9FUNG|nr:hypothetical protein EC973_007195 [Apophysomyces ossiformis]
MIIDAENWTLIVLQAHDVFKDGKLIHQEPKLRPENHLAVTQRKNPCLLSELSSRQITYTLGIVEFRSYRLQLEQDPARWSSTETYELPHEFYSLVAVIVQDSDETISILAHRINDILSPFARKEQISDRFVEAIEKVIRSVAHREKYGVSNQVLNGLEGSPSTIPAHLTWHRWEVKDISSFPSDIQLLIQHRRAARKHVSDIATQAFQNLPSEQKLAMLQSKTRKHHQREKAEAQMGEEERKLAEENELEKEEKRRKKEEEKKKKEEEKRKREEEKRLREEERKKREEEKRKKEQSQLRLTSLFSKSTEEKSQTSAATEYGRSNSDNVTMFNTRPTESVSSDFERIITSSPSAPPYSHVQVVKELQDHYLQELKTKNRKITRRRGNKCTIDLRALLLGPSMSSSDLQVLNQNLRSTLKMKLLQFAEDVRPAYYGTWTKQSDVLTGRRPLAKDNELIDYDHDSEAEWGVESEGEDIHSGDEDDEDLAADFIDQDDAGWLVPEGYLSENEGVDSDSEKSGGTGSQTIVRSKLQQNSSKRTMIRQVILGPCFENDNGQTDDELMKPYETKMLTDCSGGYDPFFVEPVAKETRFTEQHANELIHIIEGKASNMLNLVTEAKTNWLLRDVPKKQIEAKIKDLMVKEKRGTDTKAAWYSKEHANN